MTTLSNVATEVTAKIEDGPRIEDNHGRPFVAQDVRIGVYGDQVYLGVAGKAIRKDGSVGKARRYRPYRRAGEATDWSTEAPSWLVAVLESAGIMP